jgi:methionyl-tRNA synthetase
MTRIYLTTTIPYVNAAPHLGFALEAVQADVLARHHRRRGDEVRLLTGTDDNSLKNVLAADAAGLPVQAFVDRNAAAFAGLREPLALSFDDFIRTSTDPRHRAGAWRLWRACAEAGDLYQATYEGLYCVGCEHYLSEDDATCPEHPQPPQRLAEHNWFFRLSKYTRQIHDAISTGRLRIEPAARRNEVLAFVAGGLRDFSISRSRSRARGWGIEVPDDAGQVIYVWWDALGNYVSSLGFGGDGEAYRHWWVGADRRVHLIGKGVLRFHAVYWPAMLLSAGLPLPTDILVHDYLTVDGQKISKSSGAHVDPVELAERFGTDALRWWLVREVPRVGDVDFTVDRLVARANDELASGVGNLVNRVVTMIHRYRGGRARPAVVRAPAELAEALDAFDFRRASGVVVALVEAANRDIERVRPWELARDGEGVRLDDALAALLHTCRTLAVALEPFTPGLAARVSAQCTPVDGVLPPPTPLFPRLLLVDQGSSVHLPVGKHSKLP